MVGSFSLASAGPYDETKQPIKTAKSQDAQSENMHEVTSGSSSEARMQKCGLPNCMLTELSLAVLSLFLHSLSALTAASPFVRPCTFSQLSPKND